MKCKYQYKYSNALSWEQRELEILSDLWAPCLLHNSKYISTGVQRVQQKKKEHKMTLPVIMYQQHMRYMTSTLFN